MDIIAFMGQKGGSGKTTLAIHVAVAAALSGKKVAIFDLDPQASAVAWARTRGGASPRVLQPPDAELQHALKLARDDGYDLVILDTPPHMAPATSRIASVANMVVIPVRPSPMDLAALPNMQTLLRGREAFVVMSACPFRAPETKEAREIVEKRYPWRVVGEVTDRRSYFRAITGGQAVSEFEPEGLAAVEIRLLYESLSEQLAKNAKAKAS